MNPLVSVILCTHNPRADYLNRTLLSLKHQSVRHSSWELIVIDNASKNSIANLIDLSWKQSARCIVENRLGLTNARICGIKNAKADILLFVDDDNELAKNYIETAIKISTEFSQLGAFGGSTIAEYEVEPEKWFYQYASLIGIRQIGQDKWSNFAADFNSDPIGAGMVIRKVVANEYLRVLQTNLTKKNFGRKGDLLTGSDDIDMAHTACTIGYGKGVFSSLSLNHLISPDRIKESYIIKIAEGTAYSSLLLKSFRGASGRRDGFFGQIKFYKYLFTLTGVHRKIAKAYKRGESKAFSELNYQNYIKE